MPLRPNGGKLLLPVETEADVFVLFEKAKELSLTAGFFTRGRYRADIEDHFYYVGAMCPQYFRPLQTEAVNLSGEHLSFFNFSFSTWLYLLHDSPDPCVERLMQRLSRAEQDCAPYLLEAMLAAIGTPSGLRSHGRICRQNAKKECVSRYWVLAPRGKKER